MYRRKLKLSHIPVIYMIDFVHSPSVIFAEAYELEIP